MDQTQLYGILTSEVARTVIRERANLLRFDGWIAIDARGLVAFHKSHTQVCFELGFVSREMPAVIFHSSRLESITSVQELLAEHVEPMPVMEMVYLPAEEGVRISLRSGHATAPQVDLAELLGLLRGGQFRSVSFDLHGTLALPKDGWEQHIYNAFEAVLGEHNLGGVLAAYIKELGLDGAIAHVVATAKRYYRNLDLSMHPTSELLPAIEDPSIRWSLVNNYAIADLITVGDPRDILTLCVMFEAAGFDPFQTSKILAPMGIQVHRRISGSAPDRWYTLEEQQEVVRVACQSGLVVTVLSNGSQHSVEACVHEHFPNVTPRNVLTPSRLEHAGKPTHVNACLLLFHVSAMRVRNKISSKQLEAFDKQLARAQHQLAQAVRKAPERSFRLVRKHFRKFCKATGVAKKAASQLLVKPHQHLHVGNSLYHDSFPTLLDAAPIECVIYAPKDPTL